MAGTSVLEIILENKIQISPKHFMDCKKIPFDCANKSHSGNFMEFFYALRDKGYALEA